MLGFGICTGSPCVCRDWSPKLQVKTSPSSKVARNLIVREDLNLLKGLPRTWRPDNQGPRKRALQNSGLALRHCHPTRASCSQNVGTKEVPQYFRWPLLLFTRTQLQCDDLHAFRPFSHPELFGRAAHFHNNRLEESATDALSESLSRDQASKLLNQ